MKKILLYSQHTLGVGPLVRSAAIARRLANEFAVCLVNGGEVSQGFQLPSGFQVVHLPALKMEADAHRLAVVAPSLSLEKAEVIRTQMLLATLESFQPDLVLVDFFPLGHQQLAFELIPFLKAIKAKGIKVVCSLQDVFSPQTEHISTAQAGAKPLGAEPLGTQQQETRQAATKQRETKPPSAPPQAIKQLDIKQLGTEPIATGETDNEGATIQLLNTYFDQLLVHSDPSLHPLEVSFSRVKEIRCPIHYTGYVIQPSEQAPLTIHDKTVLSQLSPMILVSVGSGRFGYPLLNCIVQSAEELYKTLPHRIHMFTGPFMSAEEFWALKYTARHSQNIDIHRYTPNLMAYAEKADLSISMGGYTTTANVLSAGVRAIMLPFTGDQTQEQPLRVSRLAELERVRQITPEDLSPKHLADIINHELAHKPMPLNINLKGLENTTACIKRLVPPTQAALPLPRTVNNP